GILTTMRVRESVNGGATWMPSARIDDGPAAVNWSLVTSNMFPNMGDYSQLITDGGNVHAIWADGRDGTPDPYYARLVNPAVGVPPAAPQALSVRGLGFGPDGGIRARITTPGGSEARLELFDLAGRRLAQAAVAGGSVLELELGRGLAPGVYLLRLGRDG